MAKKHEDTRITEKQEKFVQELIKGKTQREAYKAAFPGSDKWKPYSIDINASQLFDKANVKLRYEALRERLKSEAEADCIVDAKMVLEELCRVAFANGTDYAKVVERTQMIREIDEEGNIIEKPVTYKDVELELTENLDAAKRAAISGIKQTKFGIAVEQCDKVKALELLGKHLKLFTDKIESDTNVNGNLTIKVELTDD
jgi:phage terminase small subunit